MKSRRDAIVHFSAITVAALVLILGSCVHEPLVPKDPNPGEPPVTTDDCDPDVVYFQNEVLPILVSNCARPGCHDAATAEDDIILDSYQHVMNSDVVEPLDANDSEMYEKITEDDPDDAMPPPPHMRLTNAQISTIRNWIEQGAENNSCTSENCDLENVTFSGSIFPLITNKCLGCHSGAVPSGDLSLSTFAGVQAVAQDGRLIGAVTHAAGFTPMPLTGSLADCEVEMIRIWVDAGAPNN